MFYASQKFTSAENSFALAKTSDEKAGLGQILVI
jgi:hypothetical protein